MRTITPSIPWLVLLALAASLIAGPLAVAQSPLPYQDSTRPVEERVEDLLARMTLEEKIGQMTLVEKNSILPSDITDRFIGGLLSGGGGYPVPNTPQNWARMVREFQEFALETRLGIPLIYGVDAVHGHNNLRGAVIFPHNVGLGAAGDPDLVERIGRATAVETAATGVYWNFAPVVAVPQDIRWGRTYEGYGEDTALVSTLAAAYLRGLQGDDLADPWARPNILWAMVGRPGGLPPPAIIGSTRGSPRWTRPPCAPFTCPRTRQPSRPGRRASWSRSPVGAG